MGGGSKDSTDSDSSFDFYAASADRQDGNKKQQFDPHSMGDDDKVIKTWYIINDQFNRICDLQSWWLQGKTRTLSSKTSS